MYKKTLATMRSGGFWMNCCHVFVIIKVASFFRLKLQAKPEAGKLMIGTVALLIAATSSILVVCFFYYLPLPVPLSHTVTKISVSIKVLEETYTTNFHYVIVTYQINFPCHVLNFMQKDL